MRRFRCDVRFTYVAFFLHHVEGCVEMPDSILVFDVDNYLQSLAKELLDAAAWQWGLHSLEPHR